MGRAPCCDKTQVKRGPWSPEEDNTLKNYIERFGTGGNWIALPHKAGLKRCGKSCRLRWLNYLRPNIKHGGFTEEEDNIILNLYNNIGSRWSVIASHLPGRTDNDVKNYWNTKLKKKLLVPGNSIFKISKDNSGSTAPLSGFVPKVENNYYNYQYVNSGFSNLSSARLQPAVMNLNLLNYQQTLVPHPQELVSDPVHQVSLPRLMEVSEIGKSAWGAFTALPSSSSQEALILPPFVENKYGLWTCNGGGEDDGFSMGLIGSGFSHHGDLLNSSDLQGKINGVFQI